MLVLAGQNTSVVTVVETNWKEKKDDGAEHCQKIYYETFLAHFPSAF